MTNVWFGLNEALSQRDGSEIILTLHESFKSDYRLN